MREPKDEHCVLQCTYTYTHMQHPTLDNLKIHLHLALPYITVTYKMYLFTLLHMRPCSHRAVFVYKISKTNFCSKLHNSWLISKIFTGFMEWSFWHPCIKYLSDKMILKFSQKYIDILEFNKFKRIAMIAMWLSNYMMHNHYMNNL